MKSSLSLWFILCLAVASFASAASGNDLANVDELKTTESPTDLATERVLKTDYSTELLERQPRQSDQSIQILQMIFDFFIQVLRLTFGEVPAKLNTSLVDQMSRAVTGEPAPASTSTTVGPNTEEPTLPTIELVDDSVATGQAPEVASYRRRMQQARRNQLNAGKKVSLLSPKTTYRKIKRGYSSGSFKEPCAKYLKSINSDKVGNRKVLMGYFCDKLVRA